MAKLSQTERCLCEGADWLRADSEVKAPVLSAPVVDPIFLRPANHGFAKAQNELERFLQVSFSADGDGAPGQPSPCCLT